MLPYLKDNIMEQIICIGLGFLGVICHSLIKAKDLQTDAKAANIIFTFKDYLRADWFGYIASFIAVIVWVFVFSEVSSKYPKIEDYIRLTFFGIGLTGSYLIQKVFSKGKKIIRNVVDEKTNIADNK